MSARSLHIAWLGPAPWDQGGVPEVCTELLKGLAERGHRIDCFLAASDQQVTPRLVGVEGIDFTWGVTTWAWDRWYSRTKLTAFVTGMLARGLASLRLRKQIEARHRTDPFDVIYQFSGIEGPSVPPRLVRNVPLVIHPETHAAGELRALIAERALALRCQPAPRYAFVVGLMLLRTLAQRRRVRRAALLVCISSVFRDHLVRDYRFPQEATTVAPNPVRAERFHAGKRPPGEPPTVIVLGRVVARKGVETVVAVARELSDRAFPVRIRVVGGPSLWSDYTKLLEDAPTDVAEYVGELPTAEIPAELERADVLLQASRYEPFALTVAEGLASGVPVVGTSEVGAIEGVDRAVAAEVEPGDARATADAIEEMLARLREDPAGLRSLARAEAERLFAPDVVCEHISQALQRLVGRAPRAGTPSPTSAPAATSTHPL